MRDQRRASWCCIFGRGKHRVRRGQAKKRQRERWLTTWSLLQRGNKYTSGSPSPHTSSMSPRIKCIDESFRVERMNHQCIKVIIPQRRSRNAISCFLKAIESLLSHTLAHLWRACASVLKRAQVCRYLPITRHARMFGLQPHLRQYSAKFLSSQPKHSLSTKEALYAWTRLR